MTQSRYYSSFKYVWNMYAKRLIGKHFTSADLRGYTSTEHIKIFPVKFKRSLRFAFTIVAK